MEFLEAGMGEEATKHSLVIPMVKALGYNPYNPREVRPEYEADFRDKKKGQKCKVDYAIFILDEPAILIEAKSFDVSLDGHEGQIRDYFGKLPQARLGVLTNGIEWRFFTDTKETNICDPEPFFSFNINMDLDDKSLSTLLNFSKENFDPLSVTNFGSELKYTSMITEFLSQQLDIRDGEISDDLLRFILQAGSIYEGRIVTSVLDRFRGMAKTALQSTITKLVRRSLNAIDDTLRQDEPISRDTQVDTIVEDPKREAPKREVPKEKRAIVTTDEELEAYQVFLKVFEKEFSSLEIFDPAKRKDVPVEPGYKDTTGYFGIYLNKPSWWVMRLSLDSKVKWVGFNLNNAEAPEGFEIAVPNSFAQLRVIIDGPDDLYNLNELIKKAVNVEIQAKNEFRTE